MSLWSSLQNGSGVEGKKGSSNSLSSVAELRPGEAGVDTVGFAWQFEDGALLELEESIDSDGKMGIRHGAVRKSQEPKLEGWNGGKYGWRLDPSFLGHRVGVLFEHNLIWTEGRAAPVFSRWSGDPRLVPLSLLPDVAALVGNDVVAGLGLPGGSLVASEAQVRRLDVASEVCFSQRQAGSAFLGACVGLCAGERKTRLTAQSGLVQTVELFRGTKNLGEVCARFYDKGIQSGTHGSGERIRAEVQKRYPAKTRFPVGEVSKWSARSFWDTELKRWVPDADDLQAGGIDFITEHLLELAETDELQWQEAERLIAAVAISRSRGWKWWKNLGHEASGRARKKRLMELGLLLAPDVSGSVAVGDGFAAFRSALDESGVELGVFPRDGIHYFDDTIEMEPLQPFAKTHKPR